MKALTQDQANHVYGAILEIGKIGGRVAAVFGDKRVSQRYTGEIVIFEMLENESEWEPIEKHVDEDALAKAYSIVL